MGKIRWSQEAFDWLKNVHDYIAQDNSRMAKKIVDDIMQKIGLLKDFPEVGYRLITTSQITSAKHIRVLLYGHYRIVYQLNQEQDVDLLGIFHGALDLKKYLKIG